MIALERFHRLASDCSVGTCKAKASEPAWNKDCGDSLLCDGQVSSLRLENYFQPEIRKSSSVSVSSYIRSAHQHYSCGTFPRTLILRFMPGRNGQSIF